MCRTLSYFATLGKIASLSSAKARRSAKITEVSYRRLLMALCRVLPFAECLALGKAVFAECHYVSSVLLLINVVVIESGTLPNAALDKFFFVECPTKNIRQRTEHSAKSRIPVILALATFFTWNFYLFFPSLPRQS
jgi:hypothetical protein